MSLLKEFDAPVDTETPPDDPPEALPVDTAALPPITLGDIVLAVAILIFPLALLTAPFGALLRMILGFIFDQPSPVAQLTGAIIGTLGSSFIAYSANDGWNAWLLILAVGAFAGLVGGWTWLRIEKRFLDAT